MRKSTAVILTLVITLVAVAAIGAFGMVVLGWGMGQIGELLPDSSSPEAPPAPSEGVPNAPAPDNAITRMEGPLGDPETPAADPIEHDGRDRDGDGDGDADSDGTGDQEKQGGGGG